MMAKVENKCEESKPKCTHYWIIEKPSGSISKGVCKYCGAIREFMNEPPSLFYPGTYSQG